MYGLVESKRIRRFLRRYGCVLSGKPVFCLVVRCRIAIMFFETKYVEPRTTDDLLDLFAFRDLSPLFTYSIFHVLTHLDLNLSTLPYVNFSSVQPFFPPFAPPALPPFPFFSAPAPGAPLPFFLP